jgi:Fe-S oxidoreductase
VEKYYRQYDNCRQNEKPFCSNTCPFHIDVLDFQTKMANCNYNAAYKTLRNSMGFPDIAAALCPEYCASVCPRSGLDQSVQLSLLEKTCVAKATKKKPTDYNVPLKNRKIAVIGGGISGLSCALRLAQKNYTVTIYEKSDRLGGKLWDLLPSQLFLEDIDRQFQVEEYTLHLNTEIKTLDQLKDQGFEAVYVATGHGGPAFGVMHKENGNCAMADGLAVFAGGSLTGKEPVPAMAQGLDMAWAIEIFLKTGKLEYPEELPPCKAVADQDKLIKTDAVEPTENGIFTDEETAAEAKRCIRCQCSDCMKYCDVCGFHNKWPMRIRDDVMATVAFSTSPSVMKKTPGKRLINTCTQCGLCDEVCPENIEIGGMLLEARRYLHKQDTMPGAFHQFWLRDMAFTNSSKAALTKKAPGQSGCAYAFFPGCQLGAANPAYVTEPYKWLLSKQPDTGLMLRCCSVPAEWAGNEEMHRKAIDDIKEDWLKLGKPVLIVACPACTKHFREYLPEIQLISLYEAMNQWGFLAPDSAAAGRIADPELFSVFDPCTARHDETIEQAVRALADTLGVAFEELPKGDMHGCCGYGGQVAVAAPEYYDYVKKARSALSPNPYLVYCINCRDVFQSEGKEVRHILDFLFPDINAEDSQPTLTRRRTNRTNLKEKLLSEIWMEPWEEEMEQSDANCSMKLVILPDAQQKMDRMRILEEDVRMVLEYGEKSGRRTFVPERQSYIVYRESGHLTYWVEYKQEEPGSFHILNVYSHRMKIKLEGVWNGKKVDSDL